MDRLTGEGDRLVSEWMQLQIEVERRREAWSRAQTDLNTAEKKLAEWMLPPAIKAQPGEKISIWAGDSLLQVEVGGVTSGDGEVRHMSSTRITVRYRGKHFDDLRVAS